MTKTRLTGVLLRGQPPGVYRLVSRARPATIKAEVERLGWRFFHLDGQAVVDKRTFLDTSSAAMNFPAYFGRNWDALEDLLNDLSWAPAPGYVLLYDHAGRLANTSPSDWATLLDILRGAIERWRDDGVPVYVLLRGVSRESGLPKL